VTIAKRPSERRDGANLNLIWGKREAIYFQRGDWTGEPPPRALICPSGSRVTRSARWRRLYAATSLGTTVTVQRMGLLDLTSITERTIPVTGIPFNITVAFWPLY
jgi:hypothetical protein